MKTPMNRLEIAVWFWYAFIFGAGFGWLAAMLAVWRILNP